MGKKFSWFDTIGENRRVWDQLCPPGEFRIVSPNSIPPIVPRELLAKADSVLVVASGSPEGQILYMANVHRVDSRAGAVDQEPFGLVFHGSSPGSAGCLLHHGSWTGRTTKPPPDFWQALTSSGIGNCYPIKELPSKTAGPITDLNVPSQHDAFRALVSRLKDDLDS